MRLLFICFLIMQSASAFAAKPLTFGIVPQQSASTLARNWGPLIQHLSEQSGVPLAFATAPDIPTFEARLAEGYYDIAYMNPYHFTVFNETAGYQALTKAKNKQIKGMIVVRKESELDSLSQLDGSTLAYPAPAAFAATILTQAKLAQLGLNTDAKYVSSHDSVYRAVAKGLYPAGGGVIRTLNAIEPEIRQRLRPLWISPGFTPHAIAAHPRVNETQKAALLKTLSELDQTALGQTLLKRLKVSGFDVASDDDWDDVRALDIERLSLKGAKD